MAEYVYFLCALTSVACATFLFRGFRKSHSRLLLWSSLSFGLLAFNNIVLFVDVILLPNLDFGGIYLRNASGALAGSLLLFGLIWEVT